MNNLDHISESLETIFGVKFLKFFDVDPGSGMEKFGSGMFYPGSAPLAIGCHRAYVYLVHYLYTSGFWPRVRARALHAPVFWGLLPRKTGRCAPPPHAHRSFAYSIPKNR
jgi:hypothetical protein